MACEGHTFSREIDGFHLCTKCGLKCTTVEYQAFKTLEVQEEDGKFSSYSAWVCTLIYVVVSIAVHPFSDKSIRLFSALFAVIIFYRFLQVYNYRRKHNMKENNALHFVFSFGCVIFLLVLLYNYY